MLDGPTYRSSTQDWQYCAFCHTINPSDDHLREHRAFECLSRPESQRSFPRIDNLMQHLRRMHTREGLPRKSYNRYREWCRLIPHRQNRWVCGFCFMILTDWNERANHVAGHFREGKDMRDWYEIDIARSQEEGDSPIPRIQAFDFPTRPSRQHSIL